MILSDLRSYIKQQNRVALSELVNHFKIDADALRGMLDKWVKKVRFGNYHGRIHVVQVVVNVIQH